ncbi:cytochrome P450 [Amycolatopsis vastitatis]|uniref:Steroid C27-monooxygenase n=1 Tax=Amycolatopsis vastitatis TaxID=1905142 RepID=A0A229SKR8_9PSEU|nr:cytochrome P450 [Amycolatopsis vastitatis]OXM59359.1 steroid C27-monooxygenase [Amycolatopsis vastitatis]
MLISSANLADHTIHATDAPERTWAELRETGRIAWNPTGEATGFWVLTTYEQISDAYRRPAVFSSTGGMTLDSLTGDGARAATAAAGSMLVVSDPPRHTRIRRSVHESVGAHAITALRPRIAALADELVAETVDAGPFDFADVIASRLASATICALLGAPESDHSRLGRLADTAFGTSASEAHPAWHARAAANAEIFAYYGELVSARRRRPRGDATSRLVGTHRSGERLTDDEAVLNCHGLMLGGNETTRHAATAGVLMLADRPDVLRRLQDGGVADAVEEILRLAAPAAHVLRTVRRPLRFHGVDFEEGDRITLWNGSANRDTAVFERATDFDIDRANNRHLAFGLGAHYCVGAAVARMELNALFQSIATRVRLVSGGGAPTRLRSNVIRGYQEAVVELHGKGRR